MKLHWFGLQLLGLSGKFVDHQIGFEVGGAEWLQWVVYHQKAIVLLGEVVERKGTLLFALRGGVGQAVTVSAVTVAGASDGHAQYVGIRTFIVGRKIGRSGRVGGIVCVNEIRFSFEYIVQK